MWKLWRRISASITSLSNASVRSANVPAEFPSEEADGPLEGESEVGRMRRTSAAATFSSEASRMSRSTMLRSSRTFPGQPYLRNSPPGRENLPGARAEAAASAEKHKCGEKDRGERRSASQDLPGCDAWQPPRAHSP